MFQGDLVWPLQGALSNTVLTGIDVVAKNLFAVTLTNASADTVARERVRFVFQHSYIPQTSVTDVGTSFTSELTTELAFVIENNLEDTSVEQPKTISVGECSHAMLNRLSQYKPDEHWTDWHKYDPLAVFVHNTGCHSAIGCSPCTFLQGREPFKLLEIGFPVYLLKELKLVPTCPKKWGRNVTQIRANSTEAQWVFPPLLFFLRS